MELKATTSRFHLTLILVCFTLAFAMVSLPILPLTIKVFLYVTLIVMMLSELVTWWHLPHSISLRGEKLHAHYHVRYVDASITNTETFEFKKGFAHHHWIVFSRPKLKSSACFFRDSFSDDDWRALQRAIRN